MVILQSNIRQPNLTLERVYVKHNLIKPNIWQHASSAHLEHGCELEIYFLVLLALHLLQQ